MQMNTVATQSVSSSSIRLIAGFALRLTTPARNAAAQARNKTTQIASILERYLLGTAVASFSSVPAGRVAWHRVAESRQFACPAPGELQMLHSCLERRRVEGGRPSSAAVRITRRRR